MLQRVEEGNMKLSYRGRGTELGARGAAAPTPPPHTHTLLARIVFKKMTYENTRNTELLIRTLFEVWIKEKQIIQLYRIYEQMKC